VKSDIQKLNSLIRNAGSAVIVSHENPDGDAIGSAIALSHMLQGLGLSSTIWLPGRFPTYYRWMNGSDKIMYYTENEDYIDNYLNNSDLLFAVDISSLSRTGKMHNAISGFSGKKVLIDHHIDPVESEFDLLFSDVTVSSTSELLYHLFVMMELQSEITRSIAEALYVGIMTDTGSFSFNCNSPLTYEVIASLVKMGASPDRIHKLVYDNNHENRIRLLGYALQKMMVLNNYNTAYISLDRKELEKAGSQPGDTEGIVNFALSIKNVVLAAFFSVREGEVKISFRSKGSFSVNEFARKHFNGGGHFNAAGGSFKGTIEEAVARFESILPDYQNELSHCNEQI
jgi:bifunctional oligoribonuclease and PAP phosphatase NrnA